MELYVKSGSVMVQNSALAIKSSSALPFSHFGPEIFNSTRFELIYPKEKVHRRKASISTSTEQAKTFN